MAEFVVVAGGGKHDVGAGGKRAPHLKVAGADRAAAIIGNNRVIDAHGGGVTGMHASLGVVLNDDAGEGERPGPNANAMPPRRDDGVAEGICATRGVFEENPKRVRPAC